MTLTGPITFFSAYGSWLQHCWGHKETCSTSIKGLKWGLVPAARAVRLQIWDRHVAANRHQGLHYTDFSGQEDPPMDNVALFGESTRLQRKWTMLLCPRYINDHASINACIYIIHGNSQSFWILKSVVLTVHVYTVRWLWVGLMYVILRFGNKYFELKKLWGYRPNWNYIYLLSSVVVTMR